MATTLQTLPKGLEAKSVTYEGVPGRAEGARAVGTIRMNDGSAGRS
ncbi:MAG: hypothetical protein ACKER6_00090 [Candidatus Hodgkinia cicadicola]